VRKQLTYDEALRYFAQDLSAFGNLAESLQQIVNWGTYELVRLQETGVTLPSYWRHSVEPAFNELGVMSYPSIIRGPPGLTAPDSPKRSLMAI
jgi:hypothetical protein